VLCSSSAWFLLYEPSAHSLFFIAGTPFGCCFLHWYARHSPLRWFLYALPGGCPSPAPAQRGNGGRNVCDNTWRLCVTASALLTSGHGRARDIDYVTFALPGGSPAVFGRSGMRRFAFVLPVPSVLCLLFAGRRVRPGITAIGDGVVVVMVLPLPH